MSINSLANAAAARRPDTVPAGRVPSGARQIAAASSRAPIAAAAAAVPAAAEPSFPTPAAPPGSAPTPAERKGQVETALNVLFGYIPTEVVTLYVAVLAAIGVEQQVTVGEWVAFWCFLAATPLIVWLVYAAKVRAAGLALPLGFGAWPVWEMSAATFAYLAWAFALPQSPFAVFSWYSPALSAVMVLVASAILGLVAPLFQRQLKP